MLLTDTDESAATMAHEIIHALAFSVGKTNAGAVRGSLAA